MSAAPTQQRVHTEASSFFLYEIDSHPPYWADVHSSAGTPLDPLPSLFSSFFRMEYKHSHANRKILLLCCATQQKQQEFRCVYVPYTRNHICITCGDCGDTALPTHTSCTYSASLEVCLYMFCYHGCFVYILNCLCLSSTSSFLFFLFFIFPPQTLTTTTPPSE